MADLIHNKSEVTAYVREIDAKTLRNWFVRLVDKGAVDTDKIITSSVSQGDVDVTFDRDENGQLIGFGLTIYKSDVLDNGN